MIIIKMAAKISETNEPIYDTIYNSIDEMIENSDSKNTDEIKVLKETIKNLSIKHQLEIEAKENEIQARELQIQAKDIHIQAKEIEIKERENQIQAREIEILKLENDNKLLRSKQQIKNQSQCSLTKGVEQFFFGKDFVFSGLYHDWFDVMTTRLIRNNPCMFEKFILVKVTCKNPKVGYYLFSFIYREHFLRSTSIFEYL